MTLHVQIYKIPASQWEISEGIHSYDVNGLDLSTQKPIELTTGFYENTLPALCMTTVYH